MDRILTMAAVALLSASASAQEPSSAGSDETAAAEPAAEAAVTTAATDSKESKQEREFVPPPGYRVKKFGDKVLYCSRGTTIGTRFKTERCYDEAQLKEFLAAQEQNKADIDRIRSICSNPGVCAPQ